MMFDKYGNMDSAREINEKAEALANDGDNEGLKELARENGIPVEMAEMYLNGETFELTDPMTAAVGKIEVEREELAIEGIIEDWISFIEAECMENEKMAIAVRSKRKSLVGCTAELLLHSMMHQKQVDKQILTEVERQIKLRQIDIKKAAGIEPGWIKYTKAGFPGVGKARKIIREYYMGMGGAANA